MSHLDSLAFNWRRRVYGGSCKSCTCRGRRSTLETSIVILRGRRSTLDVSCRVACFLQIAMSGLRQMATLCKSRGRCGML